MLFVRKFYYRACSMVHLYLSKRKKKTAFRDRSNFIYEEASTQHTNTSRDSADLLSIYTTFIIFFIIIILLTHSLLGDYVRVIIEPFTHDTLDFIISELEGLLSSTNLCYICQNEKEILNSCTTQHQYVVRKALSLMYLLGL
jgi:hypothetical protein